ncbi:hypothetical protein ACIQPT_22200 [Streptomyces sp. NPDC091289]|uniref:hypothetical protein n=1 Tax=Streptomyces sp. NPDC091289 TaxID=3365989 RepID=UPI0037FCD495
MNSGEEEESYVAAGGTADREDPGDPGVADGAPRLVGRWLPAVLGCVLALVLLAAFPPWPDALIDDLGSTPWWVAAPVLGAGLVLLVGAGTRRSAVWALLPLAAASVLGTVAFLTASDSGGDVRPAAPLAAALVCGLALVLCLPLVRRRRPWIGHARSPELLRLRVRTLTVCALAGALVGGLLGAGAGLGAERIREATAAEDEEEPLVNATSEPLAAGKKPFTSTMEVGGFRIPGAEEIEVGRVAWQKSLSGPAELSVCPERREPSAYEDVNDLPPDWPVQSTLVTVERAGGDDVVIGLDAADGSERWRYTVHAEGDVRLGQVGVGERCDVLVVVDPDVIVSLDSVTGRVQGMSELEQPGDSLVPRETWRSGYAWPWRLIPAAAPAPDSPSPSPSTGPDEDSGRDGFRPEKEGQRLLALGSSHSRYLWAAALDEVAFLSGQYGLAAVHRSDASLAGHSTQSDALHAGACRYLVDYSPKKWGPYLLQSGCSQPTVFELAQPALLPDGGAPLPLTHRALPSLGCAGRAEEQYQQPEFSALWNGFSDAWIVGECRREGTKDKGKAPVQQLIQLRMRGTMPVKPPEPAVTLPAGAGMMLPNEGAPWGDDFFYLENGELRALFYERVDDPEGKAVRYAAPDGEPLSAVAFLDTEGHDAANGLAVTERGTVVTFTHEKQEKAGSSRYAAKHTGRTTLARGTCAGTRDLLVDTVGERVLVLCRSAKGTEVTTLTAGPGYEPAS